MAKVEDKEQAIDSRPPSPSKWQVVKKWILHHKIETTAIVVCFLGAATILALVYARDDVDPTPAVPSTTTDGPPPPQSPDADEDSSNGGDDEDPHDIAPPPSPPTNDAWLDSPIVQQLELLTTTLGDTSSPQYQAADWLVNLDFYPISAASANLAQRFALATLYLSTGGGIASQQGWTRCSAVPPAFVKDETQAASGMQCVVRDGKVVCAQQEQFEVCQFSDEGGDMQEGKRFLSPAHECEWFGITCDDNQVVIKIDVESNDLMGSLPPELSLLTELTRLNLSTNSIGGSIPKELGLIPGIREILLEVNEFSGSIPVEAYGMTTIELFQVQHNALSGTLHPSIANWKALEVLYLNNNALSGQLPSEMGGMELLRKVTLNQNQFSGVIPSELGNLNNLESIKFTDNNLTGTMPSDLCRVSVSADCLFNEDTGVTEVTCSCCSRCCSDGGKCEEW